MHVFRYFPGTVGLLLSAFCALSPSLGWAEKTPLKLELPKPLISGTPRPIKMPNLEPPRQGRRPDVMVPEGVVNLAAGQPVTASDMQPLLGELSLITDGDKGGGEGSYVELWEGPQWIQIDLGRESKLFAIVAWHFHLQARAYRSVVVQVSNKADFADARTIYNADFENLHGLGAGKDFAYIDTYEGRIFPVDGIEARYVRLYSAGNTTSELNHYIEVEVYGLPSE